MKETVHTQVYWKFVTELLTNMTRGLICLKHYCMKHLKAYGVLFIDAQFEPLRKMEAPMFKKILKNINCLMMHLEQHNNVLKIKV